MKKMNKTYNNIQIQNLKTLKIIYSQLETRMTIINQLEVDKSAKLKRIKIKK